MSRVWVRGCRGLDREESCVDRACCHWSSGQWSDHSRPGSRARTDGSCLVTVSPAARSTQSRTGNSEQLDTNTNHDHRGRPLRHVTRRKLGSAAALLLTGILVLAGCSTDSEDDSVLRGLGLDGMSGQEVVEMLDASSDERPFAFGASVLEEELVISTGSQETTLELPVDMQYLSIAPFIEATHECYYHSLGTCQGELSSETINITITDSRGQIFVDEEQMTTFANGFIGFWVPRDVEGTIDVSYNGLAGSVPFTTTEGSPTCITSLQLT